jgi:glycosyltransferase involved in cell wall biosynthesis
MRPDVVSIIVPVFNRAALLREAVASAVAQTYRPIEIIIVDDASTDDTPSVIDELKSKHEEVRSVRRENGGPGLARESGRLEADGSFIQYLDSDDVLLPRKLELQVRALAENREAGVAYGLTRYRDANGVEIACSWKNANQVQRKMFPSFLVSRWWETVTPLYRREVTDAAGPWSDLRLEEDWEYDCRVAALDAELAFVGEVVAEHRDHAEERLSRGTSSDPERLRMRARAHELIAGHARRANLDSRLPEMQQFARELFHLARQCGAARLNDESRRLLLLAIAISSARDLRIYEQLTRLAGPTLLGKLSLLADRVR